MLAAGALMIQRRKFRELGVFRGQISVTVDCESSHSVGATLVHSDNFSLTDVGDGIGSLQDLELFAGLVVELEIFRKRQRFPNRRIFGAKMIKREASCFLTAHGAQLIEERDYVQKPHRM